MTTLKRKFPRRVYGKREHNLMLRQQALMPLTYKPFEQAIYNQGWLDAKTAIVEQELQDISNMFTDLEKDNKQ